MSALTIVVITIVVIAVTAQITAETCKDSGCTDCTDQMTGYTVNGDCYSRSGFSTKILCNGNNYTTLAYVTSDCSGSAVGEVSQRTGCHPAGNVYTFFSCGTLAPKSSAAALSVASTILASALAAVLLL